MAYSFLALAVSPVQASDDDIRDALLRINEDSMMADVEQLVAFDTRFTGSDSNWAAVAWIVERFESMGYSARLDSFEVNISRRANENDYIFSGLTQVNVVQTRTGILSPQRKIVLGAHYDSISLDRPQSGQGVAPGADDNASGVAAILEIARVMKDLSLGMSVDFVMFGAEELGLIGSTAYAHDAREAGEEIVLMMGIDVIGTRSTVFPNAFTLDTSNPNVSLAEQFADAAETFTTVFSRDGTSNARLMVSPVGCRCSDHQSFLDRGYPAIGVFQFFTNPAEHINMSFDTIDKVDIVYAVEITRAIMAGALKIAGFPSQSPDFDGSGTVDFSDFLIFADVFGSDFLEPDEERFDLDGDGAVGFSDFLLFSESFGRTL